MRLVSTLPSTAATSDERVAFFDGSSPWEWIDWISQECGFPKNTPRYCRGWFPTSLRYEAYTGGRLLRERVLGRIVNQPLARAEGKK